MKWACRVLPWALLLLLAPAAQADDLAKVLRVSEKTAPHHQPSDCPQDQAVCYADVESTLHIELDLAALDRRTAGPAAAALPSSFVRQRQALVQALDSLKRSLEISRQLVERFRAGDGAQTAEVKALSDQFEAAEGALFSALRQYVTDNAAEFGISASPSQKEIRRALADAFPIGSGATNRWIAAELQKVDRLAVASVEAVQARSQLLVRLGAFRKRKGAETVALHLPSYDNLPANDPAPFERIRFDLSPEDRQQLADETKFNNAVIAEIQGLRAEAQASGGALQGLVGEARKLVDTLGKQLAEAGDDLTTGSSGLGAALQNLRTSVDGLKQSVADLETSAKSLGVTLSGTVQAAAPGRPDLLLPQILGQLAPLQDGRALQQVLDRLKKVRDSAAAAKQQLGAAPGEIRQKLDGAVEEALAAASVDASPLLSLLNLLKTPAATGAGQDLGALLDLQMSDPKRFDVAGDSLQPTDLEILRADPARGDTIELVLQVRRKPAPGAPAGAPVQPVYEEEKAIRLDVYDWSSGVATGIGFVKSIQEDLSNFKPAPIAVWRIGYRARPDASGGGRWLGSLRPGVGIHVAALDFDPNVSVEMGAGVAVHLFSDLVQVGYGWNLSVKKDRGYWYLGIGLFDLLRGR